MHTVFTLVSRPHFVEDGEDTDPWVLWDRLRLMAGQKAALRVRAGGALLALWVGAIHCIHTYSWLRLNQLTFAVTS
jgi:hypothetical protein